VVGTIAGWPLALPDVLAAGAGDGFGGMLLGHGILANRTIFLPHDYTLVDFQGWPAIARNWRGLLASARSNIRSHFAVEAVGIEASEPSSPQWECVQIWYQLKRWEFEGRWGVKLHEGKSMRVRGGLQRGRVAKS
jgi:hypothetical protein